MMEPADEWIWLEEIQGRRALDWVRAQNARTLGALTELPGYARDYERARAVLDAQDRIPLADLQAGMAYNFWQDRAHRRGLWRRVATSAYATGAPPWEVLLDLDELAAVEQENWLFKGAACGPSQTRALVSLSRGGGDAVVIREFDLAARRFVDRGFRLPEAKSTAAYWRDDAILFASDFGPRSRTRAGYPRMVKFWRRGQRCEAARLVYTGAFDDVLVAPLVFDGPQGPLALIMRAKSFFENEYHLVGDDLATRALPLPPSAEVHALLSGWLLVTLRDDWMQAGTLYRQGALVGVDLEPLRRHGQLGDTVLLAAPETRSAVGEIAATSAAAYVGWLENVTGTVFRLRSAPAGWQKEPVDLPKAGMVRVVSSDAWRDEAHVLFESYLQPPTLYHLDGTGAARAVSSSPARFDSSALVTETFEVRSADGTVVPYCITHARGPLRPRPTILYGYGGFDVALLPAYSPLAGMFWLNEGGNYVVANIRGGGEFGPAWHDAARQENRQRAFDDFAAVSRDVVARGFCSAGQLGLLGGSNGGLLVATVMVQQPDAVGAVVCQVPLTDMLAYMRIGAGASWEAEYGNPDDPRMRAAIGRYSPYQNVRAEGTYPPILFITATSDDRVTPVHARKMAARMQAQGHRVWFYENTDGGHAAAGDHRQAAEMWALTYAWLRRELGMPV